MTSLINNRLKSVHQLIHLPLSKPQLNLELDEILQRDKRGEGYEIL